MDGATPITRSFEDLVNRYYQPLYQFAYSLARAEAEASDLTQQTFLLWAQKGHQLRDVTKVKTWLFTTLHREFLNKRRHETRFPKVELDEDTPQMPVIAPDTVQRLDAVAVMQALTDVDERYRTVLALYYLEDNSYQEIADILDIPIGTVQSRLARGKAELQQKLRAHE